MKVTKLKYVIAGIACICTIVAIITGILIFRENKLETIQNEALQELEARKGDYDEQTIVLTQTSYAKAEQLAELFGADLRITADGRFAKLTLPEGTTITDIYSNDDNRQYIPDMSADFVSRISDLDETEILEETGLLATRPNYTVSDSYYDRQTYLDYINMSSAWNSYKGNGITVAVIDTGIDTDHPEFTGRISEYSYNATEDKIVKDYLLEDGSYDWSLIEDEQGHGTAVAGVIGASMNNTEGITGIAPQVNIIVIKAECDENGVFASTADLVFGLYYAIERDVQIVNMSFGTYGQNPFALATKLAVDSDIICVAAAGNDATTALSYPAADMHVFGVGALGESSWELAPYSNYGDNTNFVAPGTVYTTLKDGQYGIMNGTSFAAPVTAGVLALYVQNNQYKTFWDIEELLYASCADLGTEGPDWLYGYGALDVSALLLEEKGTVTFDMLTDDVDDIEQLFVRNHTLQNIPEPERLYAVFDGWYYDIECTDEFNEYEDKFTADLTLYAKWGNEEDGVPFTYRELDDGTIEITGYKGRRRYITIPDIIDEKKVTSIGDYAFANETRLREVGMPKYLVNIGKGAFQGCTNLLEMEIPSTVKTIGSHAFYADARLNAIVFGDGCVLDTVGDFAFAYCSRLTRFEIPENVSSLNGSAFFGSSEIRLFTLRTGNTSFAVNGGVLFNASATTLVAYPGGLRGDYIIPNAVKYIGDYAFGYARFSNVDLGNVERIGKNAFAYSQLKAINIPDSVKQMGTEAFAYSVNLRELTIGRGLSEISGAAFAYTGVVEVVIPNNITAIQGSAFQNSSLRNISFSEESNLISIGSSAFAWTLIESISIPSRVAQIGTAAFSNCMNLENVTFDENSSINILPAGVFSDTHALKSINIPSSVEHINKNAFKNTISLQTITLPSNLKQIADYAFVNSGITSITVPDTVELIGGGAFASCHNLENINVDDKNVNYTDVDGVVYDKDKTTLVAYPAGNKRNSYTVLDGTKTIGEAAFYGSWELSRISLANSVITLSDYTFYECRHMTHYALNNNLMYIKEYTFAMNTSLSSLSIPDNVIQIGRFAFYNDMNLYSVVFTSNSKLPRLSYGAFSYCGLTSFKVPSNVSTMAQDVFMGCSALYSVTFEANSKLESISAYMFEGCNNLNTITFESGSNLTSLQAHAFDGLQNLKTINISNTKLTNIDNYAFRFCTSLSELKLPDTLTNIGRFAFYGCEQLSELVLPKDIEHIGSFAFYGDNNMTLYMQSDFLPLYLDDNWDSGIGGYYLSTSDVITSGDWKYTVLNSGNISIIEYLGTSASVDLTQLDFGGNIVSIGGYAFYFSDIEEITLPDTLINIERYAFKGSKLESVTIPASVRFIGRDAFAASAIKNVSFKSNSNLKVIEQRAFANTKNLSSITIPSSVDKMGKGVFAESNLLVIVFEDNSSLATIPEEAFAYTKIKEITIPDSITLIDHNAFRETTLLKKISFGSTNEMRIESNAFYHSGITEFNIPANITYVGEYAFVGLRNLTEFTVDENNPNYTAKDGVLMSKDAKKIIAMPAGKTGEYTVPDTVEVIGFGAFEDSKLSSIIFHENANVLTFGYRSFFNAQNITEITIPKSVMSIDYYAFGYCTSLSKVTFIEDNQLKGIYEGAFYGCKSLSDIKLPETVKEISDYAFYGCINLKEIPAGENTELQGIYSYAFAYTGITELDLPDGISDIGDYAFKGIKITSVEIPDENAKQLILGIGVFAECNYMEEIKVPFIGASYENEDLSWFGYIFGAGSIGANPTYVPESLKKIAISEGITFAGYGAFYSLANLEEIDVPYSISVLYPDSFGGTMARYELKNVITIIKESFESDSYVKNTYLGKGISGKIAFSNSLVGIEAYAFKDCSNLKEIVIPDSVINIEDGAFSDCNNLTNVKLSNCITKIGGFTFYNCSDLTNISIPDGVTSIGSYAFSGCGSLISITIPSSVTNIGHWAFSGCNSISETHIDDIESWFNISGLPGDFGMGNLYINGEIAKEIIIPSGVEKIPANAFFGCQSLTNIIIPDSVTSIGEYAFFCCSNLSSITLGAGVKSIEQCAFHSCESLKIVYNNSHLNLEIGSDKNGGITLYTQKIVDRMQNIIYKDGISDYEYVVTSDDFKFIRENGKYTLVEYIGKEEIVTLPLEIEGQSYEIYRMKGIRKVIIPYGMTSIGVDAFSDCSSLTEITIPNSITRIYSGAFEGCRNLIDIYIDNIESWLNISGLSAIMNGADRHLYINDVKTEKLIIPDGVHIIPADAFRGCSNFTEITISNSVMSIGDGAFYGCKRLTSITIGDNVTHIGRRVFNECDLLKEITLNNNSKFKIVSGALYSCDLSTLIFVFDEEIIIPKQMTKIYVGAFSSYDNIKKVTISEGVTSIEDSAFSYCSNLTEIIIPDSVTSIGWSSFEGCSNLINITIPDSVTSIGGSAFLGCSKLTEITIPNSVTLIGDTAFEGCKNLTQITIPDNVTQIGWGSFRGCSSLSSVVLGGGLISIADVAFSECSSLKEITIPNSVISVGQSAFYGCSSLSNVILGASVTVIGDYAFSECSSLKEITIPNSVISIGTHAFYQCSSLKNIYINDIKSWLSISGLSGIMNEDKKILYIDGILAEKIIIPEGVKEIPSDAFHGCCKVTEIIIPESVTVIGDTAFSGCSSLKEITIPNGVTDLGWALFEGCSSLLSISIPQSVKEIPSAAFDGCSSLEEIIIPESVTSIGWFAFRDCSSLMEITIPKNITEIKQNTFYRCSSLQEIIIPENVTTIGDSAFEACSNLYIIYNHSSLKLEFGSTYNGHVAFYARKIVDKDGNATYTNGVSNFEYIDTLDGFRFLRENGKYILIAYMGIEENVTLPLNIEGKSYKIYRMRGIKKVVIPNGITKIDEYAFFECNSLVEITIPESVTEIASYAFYDCSSLNSITISDNLTSIGSFAFNETAYYNEESNWEDGLLYLNNYVIGVKNDCKFIDDMKIKIYAQSALHLCYSLQMMTINNELLYGLEYLSNLQTLIITETPAHMIMNYFGYYPSSVPLTLKSVIVLDTVNVPDFTGMTGITIYLAADKDLVEWWNRDYPNWHNGNTVVCGGDWITAKFYNPDGSLYSYEVYKTSQVIKVPYMDIDPSEDISYELIGWDIDGDGKADSIPATSLVDIEANPIIAEKERTHTITYYDHDGNVIQSSELPYGSIIVLPEAPIKKGYTFIEWVGYTEGMTVTEDIKIYANMKHIEGDHIYTTTIIAPTCVAQGYKKHICTICDNTYIDDFTEITNHCFSDWSICTEATCVQEGLKERKCTMCGNIQTETIQSNFHDFVSDIMTMPTCKERGIVKHHCRACGFETIEKTPKANHKFNIKQISQETYNLFIENNIEILCVNDVNNKIYLFECLDCKDIKTIKSEEKTHSMSISSLNKCSHIESGWTLFKESSCTTDGLEANICILCREVLAIRIYTQATGHLYDNDCDNTCNGCEEKRDAPHVFDDENDYECNNCDYKKYLSGDVNGDDTVTSDDAVYLLRHIFMSSFYPINQSGDMNGDGTVTSDDAVYLLRHIFMPNIYPLKNS